MTFQKNSLKIAIVILIIALAIIGWTLYKNRYHSKFPAYTSECPDFWTLTTNPTNNQLSCGIVNGINAPDDSKNSKCKQYMDNSGYLINKPTWSVFGRQTDDDDCKKYKWSKKCNVKWDGISDNNTICDDD